MRFVGLSIGDPWDNRTWSSNPLYFFNALKPHGLIDAIGVQDNPILYKLIKFFFYVKYRDKELAKLFASRSQVRARLLAWQAQKKFRKFGNIDAIISTTTHIDFKRLDKPVFTIMDATWNLLAHRTHLTEHPEWAKRLLRIDKYERQQLYYARGILAFSDWVKNSCVNHYGIPEEKVLVCGHGPNLPEIPDFDKESIEEGYILFVCTDWERKGGPIVLETFEQVLEEFPDVRLKIVGRAPEEALQNRTSIDYLGFLNKNSVEGQAKMIELYKKAAVLILPTRYDPSPNITLEAMYCKTPVIVSNVDGLSEQIIDRVNGFIVPEFLPKIYTDIIIKFYGEKHKRGIMGEEARKLIIRKLSWAKIGNNIHRFINKIL